MNTPLATVNSTLQVDVRSMSQDAKLPKSLADSQGFSRDLELTKIVLISHNSCHPALPCAFVQHKGPCANQNRYQ